MLFSNKFQSLTVDEPHENNNNNNKYLHKNLQKQHMKWKERKQTNCKINTVEERSQKIKQM